MMYVPDISAAQVIFNTLCLVVLAIACMKSGA